MNFGESLTSLMFDREITSKMLASDIGVALSSVNRWKTGTIDIGLSYLLKLCKSFSCSLDYLVGKTERAIKITNFQVENFGVQVRKVMKSKNISSYKLEKETRYSGGFFTDWDNGSDPRLSTLLELANYFNCSLDELVGIE